jgi:prolyl-tRNA synthetase
MLRMSTLFLRTLRDDPADAEVASHRLLVRAGYVRRIAAGIYSWLPLGYITLRNIERVIREEMDEAGFQEVHFPALLPVDAYQQTNRVTEYGPNLFRLKDRKGGDYLLAPTHEEMFTLMVKSEYSSYKDLPLSLYQIQTKYRDEARPRSGIIRGREFVMKDSYSLTSLMKVSRSHTTSIETPTSRLSTALECDTTLSAQCRAPWAGLAPRNFWPPVRRGRTPMYCARVVVTPQT